MSIVTHVRVSAQRGGSRGIGRDTVVSLARRGVHSILTYHSHNADAESVVVEVKHTASKAVAMQLLKYSIA
jgi:NAD(P)-dependent dehydrogenase (short-subunit alcohol dehydrogenase family)